MRSEWPIVSNGIARTLGVLFLSSALAGCATVPRHDLAQNRGAVAAAAQLDPTLLAASERVNQAAYQQDIARADILPELSLRASYGTFLGDNSSSTSRASDSSYGLSLTLPLSDAVASIGGIQAATSNLNAEREAQNGVQSNVLLRVIQAAALNVKAQTSLGVLRAQTHELQQFYTRQEGRKRAGEISLAELQKIQARVSALNAELERARASAAEATIQLSAVAGRLPLNDIQPRDLSAIIPPSAEQAVQIALAENPSIREANWRQASARQQVDASMLSLGPDVSLSMNANLYENWDTTGLSDTGDNVDVRLDIRVPLFDGGKELASHAIQQSRYREQSYSARATQIDVAADVSSLWQQTRSLQTIVGYAQSRVTQSRNAYDGVLAAERIGAASIEQSLQAFNDLTDALLAHSDAKYQLIVQSHELIAMLGRLQTAYGLNAAG